MNIRHLTIAIMLINCSFILQSQTLLSNIISQKSGNFTYRAITDSISKHQNINFSNDASLIPDTLYKYPIDSTLTIEQWLNRDFINDSCEWILLESQVIIRRKRELQQSTNEIISIQGEIIGEKEKAIPFASISICGSNKGTIANEEGLFQLSLQKPSSSIQITASSLGYFSDTITILDFTSPLKIRLKECITTLPEVTFISLNPNTIINRVIEELPQNYPTNYTMLTGFFRETIQKERHYVEVTEAAVLINKPSYTNSLATERVMVEKIRNFKDTTNQGNIGMRLAGGPFHFAKLDIARYETFLNSITEKPTYKYIFEGFDTDQGRTVYVVRFKPFIDNEDLLYEGNLFIDTETSAITSASFKLTNGSIKKSKSYLVQHESGNSKSVPLSAEYQISYRPDGARWILSYVRGELKMRITNKISHENIVFTAITELAITESSEGKYQLIKDGIVYSNEIVANRATENSQLFWNDFNTIPPLKAVRLLFNE